MLQEQKRRVVGPVQVVDQEDLRRYPRAPLDEVEETVEQIPPLLLGRHLDGRRHVGEQAPELRDQLGHLRRRVTERLAKRRVRHGARGSFHYLDPGMNGGVPSVS